MCPGCDLPNKMTNDNQCHCSSFGSMSPMVMWHLDSMMWAVNFIGGQPFPFIGGCLHLWAVVFICRWSFIHGHFHLQAVILVVACRWRWVVCVGCCWQCHCAVVMVTSMVGGGGKKRVAMFGKYDC